MPWSMNGAGSSGTWPRDSQITREVNVYKPARFRGAVESVATARRARERVFDLRCRVGRSPLEDVVVRPARLPADDAVWVRVATLAGAMNTPPREST